MRGQEWSKLTNQEALLSYETPSHREGGPISNANPVIKDASIEYGWKKPVTDALHLVWALVTINAKVVVRQVGAVWLNCNRLKGK